MVGDGRPGVEQVKALRLTTRVINEAMRLYPQPPVLIRRALGPDTLAGFHLPAGADIFISVWNLHRSDARPRQPPALRPRAPPACARMDRKRTQAGACAARPPTQRWSLGAPGCPARAAADRRLDQGHACACGADGADGAAAAQVARVLGPPQQLRPGPLPAGRAGADRGHRELCLPALRRRQAQVHRRAPQRALRRAPGGRRLCRLVTLARRRSGRDRAGRDRRRAAGSRLSPAPP